MARVILSNCTVCNSKFDWDTSKDEMICPRCLVLTGDDIPSILAEIRKSRVPGQEPILKMIEILNQKIENLNPNKAAKNVASANTKSN